VSGSKNKSGNIISFSCFFSLVISGAIFLGLSGATFEYSGGIQNMGKVLKGSTLPLAYSLMSVCKPLVFYFVVVH